MRLEEAELKMREVADEAAGKLNALGVKASVTFDYMNGMLRTVSVPKKAKYVTVSVVITADGIPEGEEYCLSLGAMNKRGEVSDADLERDTVKFNEMVDDAARRLGESSDVAEVIRVMTAEAEAECNKLLAEIEATNKKYRRNSTLASAVIFAVMVLIYVIFIVGFGNGT